MPSDNTVLYPGTGGDTILDEYVASVTAKIPVSKIRLGAHGVDGGDVTVLNPFPITFGDSLALDAFGRLNTSQALSIFTNQQQYGDDPTIWETSLAGTGALTFLPNESTIQLTTGGTANAAGVVRQTKTYHRYTPGHGTTILCTFVFDGGTAPTNNTRRIGYFDANNGIYLECASGTINFVLRTYTGGSVSETRVAQSAWNIDAFGGAGPSGITLNWADAQILLVDLQWLGVGRLRVAFDVDGVAYAAHQFENANFLTTVYMTTGNLPVRLENLNTGVAGGTYTMRQICTSVTSGGGVEPSYGKLYSANSGGAGRAIANTATVPLLSIQAATTGPNSVRNTGQIIIQQYSVQVIGLNQIFWQLVLNGTLTAASFASFGTASIANIDVAATAINGGLVLDSGYLASSATNKGGAQQSLADIKELILVYSGLLSHQDVLSLVCNAPGGATTGFATLQWLEAW
jgi:hypothetical protein